MLNEHTGHGLVHVADEVELNVGGPLHMHAHLEDNIIMAGVMTDEWKGGTFITAAISDDMAAGLGLRCTAPLDVWVHGLVGMEERPGTCAAAGVLLELAGTLYEREYGPSVHGALVARHSGTVVTTMKTGFRPLMKTALGVRNLIPGGGGGGGGDASVLPPAAPPAPGGGEAAESGGALGRGVAGSDDTDEIVSVVRTVECVSETAEVENLQHPAGTADNLDDLARVEAEGTGYQQVAEIYEQPIPAAAASEPDAAPVPGRGSAAADRTPPLDLTEPEDVDLEGVDDVQHAPAADDDGHSGSTTARSVATGGEDANPTGTLSGPDDSSTASRRGNGPGPGPGLSGTPSRITPGTPDPVSTGTAPGAPVADATPVGASASDAVAGAAGTRSGLYNEPVSFEGRSLEGTPFSDDSKELAQSLEGAEIPIEDLPPVGTGPAGPRRKSILKHADDMPDPGLSYVDEDEAITDRRIEYARNTRGRSNRNADTVWRRARNRKEAVDAANARWSELAAAQRTASTSFSDDPRQILYLVEHETTLYSNTGEKIADVYRGVEPPNTVDRPHAAHYIPRPRGWEPAHETGFGRLSQGWNEFPFSHRERILNTLSKGESLNPEQIAALESGLEGYRAA